jgi:hypothetical protein
MAIKTTPAKFIEQFLDGDFIKYVEQTILKHKMLEVKSKLAKLNLEEEKLNL